MVWFGLFFSGVFMCVPVHVRKRRGRLRPATTAQFFCDCLQPRSENQSTVLQCAASSSLHDAAYSTRKEVAQLPGDWSGADKRVREKLVPLVQLELHRLAHRYMSRERTGHTLQITAILNEA